MKILFGIFCTSILIVLSCSAPNPNLTESGKDGLASLELERPLESRDLQFEDLVYVPIYSDIYLDKANQTSLLSATLSIRNTSPTDSLFVTVIDYYNTEGHLVRNYIKHPIVLSPMASINYVIEKEDVAGGSGANFIVQVSSDNPNIKPLIQAVMIGLVGNKGFAFTTEGHSIE